MILDFGAGSFRATIMFIEDGIFEIIDSINETEFGSSKLDQMIADFVIKKAQAEHKSKTEILPKSMRKLV